LAERHFQWNPLLLDTAKIFFYLVFRTPAGVGFKKYRSDHPLQIRLAKKIPICIGRALMDSESYAQVL